VPSSIPFFGLSSTEIPAAGKRSLRFILLASAVLALSACTTTKPPAIRYDQASFRQAAAVPEPPRPVQVVAVPKPVPLPGQLRPEPAVSRPAPASEAAAPMDRVQAANQAALQLPTARGFINAVQVFPYMDGAVYRLYATPGEVSDITLQAGEALTAVSAGDTVRWVVGDTTSGAGEAKRVHLLVKPVAAGLRTNLLITTDRRAYRLSLESTDGAAMAAIAWNYPQDEILAINRRNAVAETAQPAATGVAVENLHFRYALSGDNPPWRPVRVFDDGFKVYIEFPARIDQGEAPPLFIVGPTGDNQLVNYRMRGNYYVVDRLFAAAELRLGTAPQQVVRISRTDEDDRSLLTRLTGWLK